MRVSNPGRWYSILKRMCSYDQQKSEPVVVESIKHLSSKEQAEQIADKFCKVSQEYEPLKTSYIEVPNFAKSDIPSFVPKQVKKYLQKLRTNKAVPPGDIPLKLVKLFASQLSVPLCEIINSSIKLGAWSKLWKCESVTPVPKVFTPKSPEELRNISGLLNFDRVFEKLISQLVIADMEKHMDPAQFGNQRGISVQHYLIQMLHRVLTALDNNSRGDIFAVVANLVDWNNAFPRQCPKLGVESFMENGVRPPLIPLLINYFQERKMSVKWHGQFSAPKDIHGGGPQRATLGLLEYLSQSNRSADCV